MTRRANQEDGAVLLLALAFVAFMGIIGIALASYAFTNHRATVALRPVRSTEFAADGAVEGAINRLRSNPSACTNGFYTVTPTLNNQPISIDCTYDSTAKRAVLTAKCAANGDVSCVAGTKLLVARVRYQGTSNTPVVESWSVQ